MNKKAKYVNEIMNLDVSMISKYFEKLEELLCIYLKQDHLVTVSDIILMDPRVKEHIEECIMFSFSDDENFKEIDSGFAIMSDNKNIIQQIKDLVNENPDYQMGSILVAMAIADLEDVLEIE